jgi:uncharacterized iron-regulated protein
MRLRFRFAGFLFVLSLGFCWAAGAMAQDKAAPRAVSLESGLTLDQLARQLATKRVVFLGEIHNRYDNHLDQLEIIRRLHALDPRMAIGVEYFQQPFQSAVDDYIAGRISENEFLRKTEYYSRWRFDYRLYAPIFRYARAEHIPVRALNVPTDLVSAVGMMGVAGLSKAHLPEKDLAYLPKNIVPASAAYRKRLRDAFEEHSGMSFDHFVEAQLVWDQSMADAAAAYLDAHKDEHLVILAGAGHMEFGSGIPHRLERLTHASYAIVLASGEQIESNIADYFLLSQQQNLPPAGVLGVNLEEKNGEVRVGSVMPGGAGGKAGLRKGDVLVSLDGQAIQKVADARLVLWNKKPGDVIRIEIRRHRFLRSPASLNFQVKLAVSP